MTQELSGLAAKNTTKCRCLSRLAVISSAIALAACASPVKEASVMLRTSADQAIIPPFVQIDISEAETGDTVYLESGDVYKLKPKTSYIVKAGPDLFKSSAGLDPLFTTEFTTPSNIEETVFVDVDETLLIINHPEPMVVDLYSNIGDDVDHEIDREAEVKITASGSSDTSFETIRADFNEDGHAIHKLPPGTYFVSGKRTVEARRFTEDDIEHRFPSQTITIEPNSLVEVDVSTNLAKVILQGRTEGFEVSDRLPVSVSVSRIDFDGRLTSGRWSFAPRGTYQNAFNFELTWPAEYQVSYLFDEAVDFDPVENRSASGEKLRFESFRFTVDSSEALDIQVPLRLPDAK
ncbi:MAG: hypothetical protein AAGH90_10905 [Pseudomonadota bacterium]